MYFHRILFACFWFEIHILWFIQCHSSSSTSSNPMIGNKKKDSQMARYLFCSQNYFDSLSYNGQSYRFTVNRKVIHPFDGYEFVYDEFLLIYNGDEHRFYYEFRKTSSNNNNNNNILLPRGGFYIDQLEIYLDFYRNISNGENFYCCNDQRSSTTDNNNRTIDCKDLISIQSNCLIDNNQSNQRCNHLNQKCLQSSRIICRIFPCSSIQYLWDNYYTTFVYDLEREKSIYIFTNHSEPFSLSTIHILSEKSMKNYWFLKQINQPEKFRYKGAFQWKSFNGDNKIYLMVEPLSSSSTIGKRQSMLIELIDSRKFLLAKKTKSWKTFFGCNRHQDYFESEYSYQSSSTTDDDNQTKRTNFLAIYMLIILILVLSTALLLFIYHIRYRLKKFLENCFLIRLFHRF
ncbi:hypothetical protein DERP_011982 [Dermatophagoides pteronyssinus]|uniref:Uncharacterized protein n=1 Tax=Dermatophagoides pteronyssinus TaxID=6956 RepID=A0ABQ8IVK0_DERPT|nr:hypothetical protein DERP_011982 [Dermatophagoides pteronyssinus]